MQEAGQLHIATSDALLRETLPPLLNQLGGWQCVDRAAADVMLSESIEENTAIASLKLSLPIKLGVLAAQLRSFQPCQRFGRYRLFAKQRYLYGGDQPLALTETEVDLLIALSPGTPCSSDVLRKDILNYTIDSTHTLETHIYRLRQKLPDDFQLIHEKNNYQLKV